MMKCLYLFLFTSLTCLQSTFAYEPADGNITATLGPFFHETNLQGSNAGMKSPMLGGMGLIAVGDINDHASLEVAIFEMPKLFVREQVGQVQAEQVQLLHITMGYRYWFDSVFSMSTAFFSSYTMGTPRIVHSDFPANAQLMTSARDTTEYGFDFALQAQIYERGKFAVVFDGRYSLSVTSKSHEQGDHFGALIGIRYLIQEKYGPEGPVAMR